ncbi:response regulator [Sulfoacidibacillus thermotolerans]|uniref:Two-component system response regulator n=1 Tax=Sulfoacidibacillus thermotolerans TaxID=1765684 RepID=A0A2U3D870_SULT2|nr:response regulator [Sulfoacidibacillus thermotolerans]PWI57478.1 two-component system response regulator [Sulfoacidibacillus thermotolerans]
MGGWPLRIMIVDDSLFMRGVIRQVVTSCGWEVVGEASDGTQVLQLYETCGPDLVTMDITMPKQDGVSALKELKTQHQEALVVMISAIGQKDLVMEAIQAGAAGFVTKPFQAYELCQEIKSIMRYWR